MSGRWKQLRRWSRQDTLKADFTTGLPRTGNVLLPLCSSVGPSQRNSTAVWGQAAEEVSHLAENTSWPRLLRGLSGRCPRVACVVTVWAERSWCCGIYFMMTEGTAAKSERMRWKGALPHEICLFRRLNLPPLDEAFFSRRLTVWTLTVSATVNWHNCQLFLSKEFQPENCVLSINHKTLTHCSSVSWVRASSLFRERQRLSSETTPPPLHTLSQMQSPPHLQKNPTSPCTLL